MQLTPRYDGEPILAIEGEPDDVLVPVVRQRRRLEALLSAIPAGRAGYAAVPETLVEPLTRFLVNATSCVPPFVQRAGVAALTGPQDGVERMRIEFRARPALVVSDLAAMPGVTCRVPHGAFYAFPNVTGVPLETEVLADRLLDEAGVALLSGTACGAAGEGHLRISYATSRERLTEGLARMRAFLEGL